MVASQAKEAAKEVKMIAYSAVASGVTAKQAIASREPFEGPASVLPPPPKQQYQSRNAKAEPERNERDPDDEADRKGNGLGGGDGDSSAVSNSETLMF